MKSRYIAVLTFIALLPWLGILIAADFRLFTDKTTLSAGQVTGTSVLYIDGSHGVKGVTPSVLIDAMGFGSTDTPTLSGLTIENDATQSIDSIAWLARYRASALSGNDGDAVTTWTDSVNGHDATQGTAGSQPVLKTAGNGINGKNVVRFDGSADFLQSTTGGTSLTTGAFYMAAVTKFTSTSGWQAVVDIGNTTGTGTRRCIMKWGVDAGMTTGAATFNGRAADVDSDGLPEQGSAVLLECYRNTSNTVYVALNGMIVGSGSPTLNSFSNAAITLGSAGSGSTEYLAGDLAEVLVLAANPTETQLAQVRRYVASEYGIETGYGLGEMATAQTIKLLVNGATPQQWGTYSAHRVQSSAAINGSIYASSGEGEHLFRTTTGPTTGLTRANVLALQHTSTTGCSAVRFLDTTSAEPGAVGYCNTGADGWYLDGAVYLSGSILYGPGHNGVTPTTGNPTAVLLGQEGYYGGALKGAARVKCDTDWSVNIMDPNANIQMRVLPNGPVGLGGTITNSNTLAGAAVYTTTDGSKVGIATNAPHTALTVNGPIATAYSEKTAGYTLTATDSVIHVTANSITLTLEAATSLTGREHVLLNSGAGTITLTSDSTITGTTSIPAGSGTDVKSYRAVSNGTGWIVY